MQQARHVLRYDRPVHGRDPGIHLTVTEDHAGYILNYRIAPSPVDRILGDDTDTGAVRIADDRTDRWHAALNDTGLPDGYIGATSDPLHRIEVYTADDVHGGTLAGDLPAAADVVVADMLDHTDHPYS